MKELNQKKNKIKKKKCKKTRIGNGLNIEGEENTIIIIEKNEKKTEFLFFFYFTSLFSSLSAHKNELHGTTQSIRHMNSHHIFG